MSQKKKNSLTSKKQEPHPMVNEYFDKVLDGMVHSEVDMPGRIGLAKAVQAVVQASHNVKTEVLGFEVSHEDFADYIKRQDEIALPHSPSYRRAQEIKQELHWRDLAGITLGEAIGSWLQKITNPRTKRTYEMAMQELTKKGLINPQMSLQAFSMRNHDVVVDEIKSGKFFYKKKTKCKNTSAMLEELVPWSEATRQQRAAAFIALTAHLERAHGKIIRKALPDRLSKDKTFYRVRSEVKTSAFQTRKDLKKFLDCLNELNHRDYLVAKMQVQGGRRIGEVLSVETNQINYERKEVTFKQSKTKGVEKTLIATYNQEFMDELKTYLGDREGLVFVSSKGTPLFPQHVERNFKKAGERAGITFKVRPHVMRASAVTHYKMSGCTDSDISKLTGQSGETLRMYDKSDKAQNASKIVSLI